jgi:hypothetical protein
MATNGASENKTAWSDEKRKNLVSYFWSKDEQFGPERQIHHQEIDTPNVNLVAFALENTKRQNADLKIDKLDEKSALHILFSAFRNKKLHSKQLALGKFVEVLDHVDSGDAEVVYANSLKIHVESLTYEEAQQLNVLINESTFSSIDISIGKIPEGSILTLLGVIGQNPHIEHIDIKIPRYNVNDLGALRAFLAQPLVQPQETESIDSLAQFMSRVTIDLGEVTTAASVAYEDVRQRTAAFLTAYVRPAIAFLTEDEPEQPQELAAALSGRQSPRPRPDQ